MVLVAVELAGPNQHGYLFKRDIWVFFIHNTVVPVIPDLHAVTQTRLFEFQS